MMKILFLVFSFLFSASSFGQHGQANLSDEFKISENDDYKDQIVANSVFHHCCPRKKERGRREAAPFFIAFVITTSKKP